MNAKLLLIAVIAAHCYLVSCSTTVMEASTADVAGASASASDAVHSSLALSASAGNDGNNTAWTPTRQGSSQTTFFLLGMTIMVAVLFSNALKC